MFNREFCSFLSRLFTVELENLLRIQLCLLLIVTMTSDLRMFGTTVIRTRTILHRSLFGFSSLSSALCRRQSRLGTSLDFDLRPFMSSFSHSFGSSCTRLATVGGLKFFLRRISFDILVVYFAVECYAFDCHCFHYLYSALRKFTRVIFCDHSIFTHIHCSYLI